MTTPTPTSPSTAMTRMHAFVSGRVQGVAFRAAAQVEARRLLLSGWVRNLADGRVELDAVGTQASVDALRAWLERGPPGARVERLEVHCSDAATDGETPLPGFHITR